MTSAGAGLHTPIQPPSPSTIAKLLQHVEPAYQTMCSDILYGRPASFAQAWQDWYLFHNIFPDRLEWGGGFYVEIGVWNPIMTSNTLFFDKCLGWSGVCFEPNENWWPAIQRERSCKLVRNCVLGEAKKVQFSMAYPQDGRAGVLSADAQDAKPQRAKAKEMQCVVADDALRELGLGDASIDLLSVDVEGFEHDVLRCFPFEKYRVKTVLLETNLVDNLRVVDRFFHRHNFVNRESFTIPPPPLGRGRKSSPPQVGEWLDNLYVRAPRVTRYPLKSGAACTAAEKRHHGRRCLPWAQWEPLETKWGECSSSTARGVTAVQAQGRRLAWSREWQISGANRTIKGSNSTKRPRKKLTEKQIRAKAAARAKAEAIRKELAAKHFAMEEDACGTARIERAEPKLLVPGRNLFLNMSLQWPVTQGGFEGAQPSWPKQDVGYGVRFTWSGPYAQNPGMLRVGDDLMLVATAKFVNRVDDLYVARQPKLANEPDRAYVFTDYRHQLVVGRARMTKLISGVSRVHLEDSSSPIVGLWTGASNLTYTHKGAYYMCESGSSEQTPGLRRGSGGRQAASGPTDARLIRIKDEIFMLYALLECVDYPHAAKWYDNLYLGGHLGEPKQKQVAGGRSRSATRAFHQYVARVALKGHGLEVVGAPMRMLRIPRSDTNYTGFERQLTSNEKNWMPWSLGNQLFVSTGVEPHSAILVPTWEIPTSTRASVGDAARPATVDLSATRSFNTSSPLLRQIVKEFGFIAGGTPAIRVHSPLPREVYIGIVHVKSFYPVFKLGYAHFFVAFEPNPPFRMVGVSRMLRLQCDARGFGTYGIPNLQQLGNRLCFPAGIEIIGGNLWVSYGAGDARMRMWTAPWKEYAMSSFSFDDATPLLDDLRHYYSCSHPGANCECTCKQRNCTRHGPHKCVSCAVPYDPRDESTFK